MMFGVGVVTGLALSVLLLMGFLSIATHKLDTTTTHRDSDSDSLPVARNAKDRRRRRARATPDSS